MKNTKTLVENKIKECEHKYKALGLTNSDNETQKTYYVRAVIFCEKCGEIKKQEV